MAGEVVQHVDDAGRLLAHNADNAAHFLAHNADEVAHLARKGTDVALGLRTIDGVPSLRPFGDRLGAVIDEDWARLGLHDAPPGRFDLAFRQTLDNAVGGGGRIKFNLDSLDVQKALAGNPVERVGRYTEWELQQIVGNRKWFEATDFFLNRRRLTVEELLQLGIR